MESPQGGKRMTLLALPNLYSEQEAAKALSLSVDTVRRARRDGSMPFRRLGNRVRYTETDLLEYLERRRENGICPIKMANPESMATIGLASAPEAKTGIEHGSTPMLDKPAASRLARQTFGKPATASQLGSWKTERSATKGPQTS
jgi:excisionase family DNA binding protein